MDGDEARYVARWIVVILILLLVGAGAIGVMYKINQKFLHPAASVSGE